MAIPAPSQSQLINGSFEDGATGWNLTATGNGVIAVVPSADSYNGAHCVRHAGSGEFSDGSVAASTTYPVSVGQSITMSAYVYPIEGTPGTSGAAYLMWMDGNGNHISTSWGNNVARNNGPIAWRVSVVSAAAPTGAASVIPGVSLNTSASDTQSVILTDSLSWNYVYNNTAILSQPSSAQTYSADASLPFRVSVNAPAGTTVTKVVYKVDGNQVGEATEAPWGIDIDPLEIGTYVGTADVTFSDGSVVTTAPVTFTVGEAPPEDTREYRASNAYTNLIAKNFVGIASSMPPTANVVGMQVIVDYSIEVLVRSKDKELADPSSSRYEAVFSMAPSVSFETRLMQDNATSYTYVGSPMSAQQSVNPSDYSVTADGISEEKRWTTLQGSSQQITIGGEAELFGVSFMTASDFVNKALGIRFYPNLTSKPSYADAGDACYRVKIDKLRVQVYFDAGSVEYYFVSPDGSQILKGTLVAAYVDEGKYENGDAKGIMQVTQSLTPEIPEPTTTYANVIAGAYAGTPVAIGAVRAIDDSGSHSGDFSFVPTVIGELDGPGVFAVQQIGPDRLAFFGGFVDTINGTFANVIMTDMQGNYIGRHEDSTNRAMNAWSGLYHNNKLYTITRDDDYNPLLLVLDTSLNQVGATSLPEYGYLSGAGVVQGTLAVPIGDNLIAFINTSDSSIKNVVTAATGSNRIDGLTAGANVFYVSYNDHDTGANSLRSYDTDGNLLNDIPLTDVVSPILGINGKFVNGSLYFVHLNTTASRWTLGRMNPTTGQVDAGYSFNVQGASIETSVGIDVDSEGRAYAARLDGTGIVRILADGSVDTSYSGVGTSGRSYIVTSTSTPSPTTAQAVLDGWTIHSAQPPTEANQIGIVAADMYYNGLPISVNTPEERNRYQFISANFYGDLSYDAIYGVNGVDRAFAYNGDFFYKIHTQSDPEKDKPRHVEFYHTHLALGFKEGRVDISVVGEPYNFSGVDGASSFAIGDSVTGLLNLSGTMLGVFCRKSIHGVAGTTVDNFATQVLSPKIGAIEYTVTDMGFPVYANAYGIYTLAQTANYGDYLGTPMSQPVSPWLRPRLNSSVSNVKSVICSWPVRAKNQYKLAFADGYVLTMTINNGNQEAPTFSKQMYTTDSGALIPGAISSELDEVGQERIHVAAMSYATPPDPSPSVTASITSNGCSMTELMETIFFDSDGEQTEPEWWDRAAPFELVGTGWSGTYQLDPDSFGELTYLIDSVGDLPSSPDQDQGELRQNGNSASFSFIQWNCT